MRPIIAEVGTHRERLREKLATTQGSVRVASAYVTETRLLLDAGSRDIRLLTTLSTMDLVSRATSLDSLRTLVEAGVQCRSLPNHPKLHAKVYIFGDEYCAVVTSANLTASAMDSNIEVGVQLSGNDVRKLTRWFDGLWNSESAQPLDAPQIDSLAQRIAALRQEFSGLRARCRLLDRPETRPNVAAGSSSSHARAAFGYFRCNTDRAHSSRTATGGYDREELMLESHYAAAWEEFRHTGTMAAVKRHDIIFMYANRVGIIAVGKALGACERLETGDPRRILQTDYGREWRIPVIWLWLAENGHACPWHNPLPPTFVNVSGAVWSGRRESVNQELCRLAGDMNVVDDLGL
jgi:hypothetical protein